MRLYEIVDALADDSKYINSETGEIDVELLDKLTVDYNDKIDSICTIIQEREADDAQLAAEIERLNAKRKRNRKRIDGLKNYLAFCIPDKWSNTRYTVHVRTNTSVEADINAIPDEYKRTTTTVEVDKKKIADQLKLGVEVPGATLKSSRSTTIK